jgi:peptide/nickel transport system substrate-binding protein
VKEKILSFLKRLKIAAELCVKDFGQYMAKLRGIQRIQLKKISSPSPLEIRYTLRTFSFQEKIIFLLSIGLLIAAGLGLLRKIDRSLAVEIPKRGGTLSEGIIGTPRFINPLLSLSDADRDLTNLIYSGLMRADEKGGLMPDLAERYDISDDGLSYTFILKDGLSWPDKYPMTSDDVVFTIQMAKNPILKSSQRASWEGVEVEKVDDRTVRFFLKRPYAPFLENTTIGILPKHIWNEIPPEQMSLTDFDIKPVGSGPYQIKTITKDSTGIIQSYTLQPNNKFTLGKPFIANLVLKFYPSEKKLIAAYENGEIDGIGGVSSQNVMKIKREDTELKKLLLPRVFGVFFNQNNAAVFANKEVRQALNLATDKEKIVKEVLQNFGSVLDYPLPAGALGALELQEKINQSSYEENLAEAVSLLKKSGWTFNDQEKVFEKKIKKKETLKLEFSLSTSNAPELVQVAELLKSMWEKFGAKVNVKIFEIGDLNQNVIRPRKYDALLFGMVMSRDPDPFAFWHSSQRNDPGLNIALYTNITADKLLEEARVISDIQKRKEKYQKFQEQVEKDAPAVFLYSPEYLYLVPGNLKGFETDTITIPSERFSQIYKWYTETEKVWKNFAK